MFQEWLEKKGTVISLQMVLVLVGELPKVLGGWNLRWVEGLPELATGLGGIWKEVSHLPLRLSKCAKDTCLGLERRAGAHPTVALGAQ